MPPIWLYHLCGLLLLAASGAACVGTYYRLPGGWVIWGLSLLAAWFLPERPETGLGCGWGESLILLALAIAGEAASRPASGSQPGAPRRVGSVGDRPSGEAAADQLTPLFAGRRLAWSAGLGALVGAVAGLTIGLPVPILGPLIAGSVGSAGGAILGVYVSERWLRKSPLTEGLTERRASVQRVVGRAAELLISVLMVGWLATAFWLM